MPEQQPVFRLLDLPAVGDALPEEPVLVPDAVAEAVNAERRHGIQEAGGETAQAAVAQRGIRFAGHDGVKIDAELGERLAADIADAEVEHGVREEPTNQVLHRQVVDALRAVRTCPARRFHPRIDDPVAKNECQRDAPVPRESLFRLLADGVVQTS
jgi:hypothetical protein